MTDSTNTSTVLAVLVEPVQKTAYKPRVPKAPFNSNGDAVVSSTLLKQLIAVVYYGDDGLAACATRGSKEGYPVRIAIDAATKCVVIPAGEFARIRTGLMVDQPIVSWTQSALLDAQAAVSKVTVEKGEVIAYVTGVGADVTIYEGSWLVRITLGDAK